jgi:streptogramin lyase
MNLLTRRTIVVAAFFAITGCGGGSGQTSLTPTSASSLAASRLTTPAGVPPGMLFSVSPVTAHRAVHAAGYPTKNSLVFVSNFLTDTVGIYQTATIPSNPAPIATITEPSGGCPYDMAVDNAKTLYLADSCLSQVELYPKGSTTMKTTITDGLSFPLGVAIDKSQTLYVSTRSEIQEYAKGSTSPTKTVSGGMSEPFGLSLDASGNLYIADWGDGAVFELPAGGSSVTNLNLQDLSEPLGTAVDDKTGYLWVTDGVGNKVNVYQLGGSTSPVRTIAGKGFPYSISIQNHFGLHGAAVEGDIASGSVDAFHAGRYAPYATLTNGVGDPVGVLITRP